MGYEGTRGRVMEYLITRKEEDVTLDKIMRGTGLTKSQIQHQMNKLINLEYPIKVLVRGQIWRYEEKPESEVKETANTTTPVGSLWECIGMTKKGDPILKDESGILYVAKELDI